MAACGRTIGQHGPGFTLAQVAAEAGVAVGTVAGRFRSKQNLLLAMMTATTTEIATRMRAAGTVTSAVLVGARGVDDPATSAQHLAQLGVDLADPALRAAFALLRERVRAVLTDLLTAADLPSAPPPAQAARIIAALAHGTTLDWALNPNGSLTDVLTADITAVLDGWR